MVRFTATYSCDFGYSIVGDITRNCLINGAWSDSQPQCTLDTLIGSVVAVSITLFVMVSLVGCCILYYRKRRIKRLSDGVETFELTERPRLCKHTDAC